jgi:hypothetical protein
MSAPNPVNASRRMGRWLWLAAYLAMIALVTVGMFAGRRMALEQLSTPEAKAEWEAWRTSEPNVKDVGGVKRRPPTSNEPPALVLLRDHFGVMLFGAVFFSTLLFAAVAFATSGVLAGNAREQP